MLTPIPVAMRTQTVFCAKCDALAAVELARLAANAAVLAEAAAAAEANA